MWLTRRRRRQRMPHSKTFLPNAKLCFKKATADVGVGVRRVVVVHVERPVILVLVIVTAEVQTRVGSIEVPVIRRTEKQGTDCVRGHPLYFQAACAAENPLAFCAACGPQDTQRGMRPPLRSPVRGVFGGGSRCTRTSRTRWYSSRRTARGSRPGYSNRRSTDTGWKQ